VLKNSLIKKIFPAWGRSSLARPTDIKRLGIGFLGEEVAAEFLKNKNYKILDRNWRCRAGEIDIVCQNGSDLVFVEVKSRRESPIARDNLFENITLKKRKRLRLLKDLYLNKRTRLMTQLPNHRVDYLGVVLARDTLEPILIEHRLSAC